MMLNIGFFCNVVGNRLVRRIFRFSYKIKCREKRSGRVKSDFVLKFLKFKFIEGNFRDFFNIMRLKCPVKLKIEVFNPFSSVFLLRTFRFPSFSVFFLLIMLNLIFRARFSQHTFFLKQNICS